MAVSNTCFMNLVCWFHHLQQISFRLYEQKKTFKSILIGTGFNKYPKKDLSKDDFTSEAVFSSFVIQRSVNTCDRYFCHICRFLHMCMYSKQYPDETDPIHTHTHLPVNWPPCTVGYFFHFQNWWFSQASDKRADMSSQILLGRRISNFWSRDKNLTWNLKHMLASSLRHMCLSSGYVQI